MILKGEAQSRITTTLPLQSTLESTGASPFPTFFIHLFFPVHFYNSWAVLKSHKAPDDNWRGLL